MDEKWMNNGIELLKGSEDYFQWALTGQKNPGFKNTEIGWDKVMANLHSHFGKGKHVGKFKCLSDRAQFKLDCANNIIDWQQKTKLRAD